MLSNIGLGPAVLVSTRLFLDDELIGGIDRDSVNRLRAKLKTRPSASTFVPGEAIGKDASVALLSLPNYDREKNAEFADLILSRLSRVVVAFADLDSALSMLLDDLFWPHWTGPSVSLVDSEVGKALQFDPEQRVRADRMYDGESTEWKFTKCMSVLQDAMPYTSDEAEMLRTNIPRVREIINERNRYVHAQWTHNKTRSLMVGHRGRRHKDIELFHVSIDDLEAFSTKINEIATSINAPSDRL